MVFVIQEQHVLLDMLPNQSGMRIGGLSELQIDEFGLYWVYNRSRKDRYYIYGECLLLQVSFLGSSLPFISPALLDVSLDTPLRFGILFRDVRNQIL